MKHARRHPLQFMMWNHVFMLQQSIRALEVNKSLGTLGIITTLLSVHRHWLYEPKGFIEPYVAKFTSLYMAYLSMYLHKRDMVLLMLSKAFMLFVWFNELRDYEKIHPWLHILISIDAWYLVRQMKQTKTHKPKEGVVKKKIG